MLARNMLSSCVCPSVRPFVTRRYCIETTGRIGLVLDIDVSFHLFLRGATFLPPILPHPTPYYREIRVSVKSKGTFFWNFSESLDSKKNFATASRSRVVNKTHRRSNLLTTLATVDARRRVRFTTRPSTVTLQLHYFDVCCGFVVKLVPNCAAVDLGPDLQNILRQSDDYLTIMPKLRSTRDGRPIDKTSCEWRKAFLGFDSLAELFVRSSETVFAN